MVGPGAKTGWVTQTSSFTASLDKNRIGALGCVKGMCFLITEFVKTGKNYFYILFVYAIDLP